MTKEVWIYFSEEQLKDYIRLSTESDSATSADFLAGILGFKDYRFEARDAIKLDYASYNLAFASEQNFGLIRTAALYNFGHNLLLTCMGGASLADAEATAKSELISACRPKPGADTPFFSPEMVARIGQYFARTLFAHYRLYQQCFNTEQDLTEYTDSLLVETPIIPLFNEAIPEAEWIAQVEEKRVQKEAEEASAAAAAAAAAEKAELERTEREKAEAHAARMAELAKKPGTLEEAVEKMVALRLEKEREILATEYKSKEDILLQKLENLEARARPSTVAEAGKKK
ncbi:hypothetical protein CEUSTIGMA_g8784.t1 [Chlamydomonas eustigma]|uniref:Uncharacterized protein n=1 Tax=Chlamydomonas eustigma TaxID=1157962 RepID=A0A250XE49_9CHLO|nr:hypothetical protein CEUSTIGMA_g8784.t1 [Chlamydomonas eustigma]|eukprot:GAX81353.1 hypothetical protein CEUSTIGMA_g8784.t1 [Chlamydomonas eustigma]